jgi:uncharacterized protein (TIGR03067 family)
MITSTLHRTVVAHDGRNRGACRRAGLAGIAMFAVATVSAADLYKSTDANGRVQYSDKPPPGAAKAMIADGATKDLEGRWRVANTTMNGELSLDRKSVGATWTFRGDELLLETADGNRARYTVVLEAGSRPNALQLAPVPPSKERGGWMIYEREGDRLRFAYRDNLEGRPVSFAPQPKLVVTTLIAMDGGSGRATGTSARDPCATLRAAGIEEFLGTTKILATPGTPDPTASCRIEQGYGLAVTLVLVSAATRATIERERAKRVADSRNVVQDEPALGAAAFSSLQGNGGIVMALKGDTLVMMAFNYPPNNRDKIVQLARRVLTAN